MSGFPSSEVASGSLPVLSETLTCRLSRESKEQARSRLQQEESNGSVRVIDMR